MGEGAHPRHYDPFHVFNDVVVIVWLCGGLAGDQITKITRFHIWVDWALFYVLQVVRDIVHHLLPSAPEVDRIHLAAGKEAVKRGVKSEKESLTFDRVNG